MTQLASFLGNHLNHLKGKEVWVTQPFKYHKAFHNCVQRHATGTQSPQVTALTKASKAVAFGVGQKK